MTTTAPDLSDEELATVTKRIEEMALGLDCAASCDAAIVDAFLPKMDEFLAWDRKEKGEYPYIRQIREAQSALSEQKRFERQAADLRAILAELKRRQFTQEEA